ncbi:MAG: YqgE/AlgH family protein [Acetobacter sp.]|nr:YqgE/AlgH family protein [Acetobacter sp.]
MDSVSPKIVEKTMSSLTGMLLVATPVLEGTSFARTVIYMCAHTTDGGAMGLVVNRRLLRPDLEELLEQLQIKPFPPIRRVGLFSGGPVNEEHGFVLHSSDWNGEESIRVTENMTLTASKDILKEIAEGNGPQDALLVMGHSGWAAGQLEEEILKHDAWFIVPSTRDLVFGTDQAIKWRKALASIGVDPTRLVGQSGRA